MNLGGNLQQARAFSTSSRITTPNYLQRPRNSGRIPSQSIRGYATVQTNPNPPFGKKSASSSKPAKVALIGVCCVCPFHTVHAQSGHQKWTKPRSSFFYDLQSSINLQFYYSLERLF